MSHEPTIDSMLNQQLLQVQQLEKLLLIEKEVLQQHNPEELLKVSHQKTDLLVTIEATKKECNAIPDFQNLITSPEYQLVFNKIEETLASCKSLNTVNGMIIQQSSLAIDRMQSDLIESRSRSSMTYDNKGKKNGGLQGKSIKA